LGVEIDEDKVRHFHEDYLKHGDFATYAERSTGTTESL
jgi:hypothetical protein